jgi:thiosulfate/3-mercaptopyruvate sulfurtransferase
MTYERTLGTKLLWIVPLSAVMGSCASDGGDTAERAYANDVLVDTEWIEAHMGDSSVRLLEVGGNADAFGEGHLPGASFLSMGRLSNPDDAIGGQIATAAQVSAALSGVAVERDQTVVLYDRRNNLSAARAYWVLKYYQHADVRIYNGGTPKWSEDGRALSTVMVEYEPSDYQAGPADPEIRTTWQYVVDQTENPSTLFCDARGPEEYLGRDVRAERGGHIPGSINVEWTAAVNSNGTFKSFEELTALYGGAGFRPDKQIITYCQSGVRAAHTWFVLKELLGYPSVRNYDGSWGEYGNNPESPIESA